MNSFKYTMCLVLRTFAVQGPNPLGAYAQWGGSHYIIAVINIMVNCEVYKRKVYGTVRKYM